MGLSNYVPSSRISQAGVCTSTTRPAGPYEGQMIYETDTDRTLVWNGSYWSIIGNKPAFYAYGVAGTITNNSDVVYVQTRLNVGSCYSTTTGRFTAPVSGVYYFSWNSIGFSTNEVYRFVPKINGSVTGSVQLRLDTSATGSEYGSSANKDFMVFLNAGDYLNIYYYSDSGNAPYSQNDEYTAFMGFLIG